MPRALTLLLACTAASLTATNGLECGRGTREVAGVCVAKTAQVQAPGDGIVQMSVAGATLTLQADGCESDTVSPTTAPTTAPTAVEESEPEPEQATQTTVANETCPGPRVAGVPRAELRAAGGENAVVLLRGGPGFVGQAGLYDCMFSYPAHEGLGTVTTAGILQQSNAHIAAYTLLCPTPVLTPEQIPAPTFFGEIQVFEADLALCKASTATRTVARFRTRGPVVVTQQAAETVHVSQTIEGAAEFSFTFQVQDDDSDAKKTTVKVSSSDENVVATSDLDVTRNEGTKVDYTVQFSVATPTYDAGASSLFIVIEMSDGATDQNHTTVERFKFIVEPKQVHATCRDWQAADGTLPSGAYDIKPDAWDGQPFQVWCDMDKDGGGWTLIDVLGGASRPQSDIMVKMYNPLNMDQMVARGDKKGVGSVHHATGDWSKSDLATVGRARQNAIWAQHGKSTIMRSTWSHHALGYDAGLGISGNSDGCMDWFYQRLTPPNGWDLWMAIRNTELWGDDKWQSGSNWKITDSGDWKGTYNSHCATENKDWYDKDTNQITRSRFTEMFMWEYHTYEVPELGSRRVSRHGIPGDPKTIHSTTGCMWEHNLQNPGGTDSYVCGITNGAVFRYLK